MGVPGLWDVLKPAAKSRALANLAVVDGFEPNKGQKRAYRIGVDVSLWFRHAEWSKEGENPRLRFLFFRLADLAKHPLLLLFVFDGRNRPKVKRGSKMGKSGSHALTAQMKELLDVFGMEWRMAEGEAEAELAYLNRAGIIDAVLTDDGDAFLFGARTIIRSLEMVKRKVELPPDLNGKKSKHHVRIYDASDIKNHPDVQMSQGGMILFALLTGGDYDKGVDKFGPAIGAALARCGFGDSLLEACEARKSQSLPRFLSKWRKEINLELKSNSRGFLGRAHPNLELPDCFPSLSMIDSYVVPMISTSAGRNGGGQLNDTKEMHLPKIAGFCEKYFEWGTRAIIPIRFQKLLWLPALMRILRRAALEQDLMERDRRLGAKGLTHNIAGASRPSVADAVGTDASLAKRYLSRSASADDYLAQAFVNRGPQPRFVREQTTPLIVKLNKIKTLVMSDYMSECDVLVDPQQFYQLTLSGIKGTRPDSCVVTGYETDESNESDDEREEGSKKKKGKTASSKKKPDEIQNMKCPTAMLQYVNPQLVEAYEHSRQAKEDVAREKEERKKERERKKVEKQQQAESSAGTKAKAKDKGKGKRKAQASETEDNSEGDSSDRRPSLTPPKRRKKSNDNPKPAARARQPSGPGEKRRESRLEPFPLSKDEHRKSYESIVASLESRRDAVAPHTYEEHQFRPSPDYEPAPSRHQERNKDISTEMDDLAGGFLFSLPDSDNPNYVERDDLNSRFRQSLSHHTSWNDIGDVRLPSSPGSIAGGSDDANSAMDVDFDLDLDSRLDKHQEVAFMAQARTRTVSSSNAAQASQKRQAVGNTSASRPAAAGSKKGTNAQAGPSRSQPRKDTARVSQAASSSSSYNRPRVQVSSPLPLPPPPALTRTSSPRLRSSSPFMPPPSSLFLPSPPPPDRLQRYPSSSSSQTTASSQTTEPISNIPIEIDSSDDDNETAVAVAVPVSRSRKGKGKAVNRNSGFAADVIVLSDDNDD